MNRKSMMEIVRNNGILFVILLLILVTGITERNFLTIGNLLNVLRQVAVVGIVACGMTYCIIGGAFDLSVGSVVSLAGVITILSINSGTNEFVAIAFGLLAGVTIGVINGVLISLINGRSSEAFIVTYGMQVVVASIALFPSNGLFIAGRISDGFFKSLGQGFTPIVIFLGIATIMQFVLMKTRYGRHMCFIGSNMNVAKMSGINVKLNRISYFALSGLLAGLGGIVLCSRVTSSNPTVGLNYEMDVIAAVVVGGTPDERREGECLQDGSWCGNHRHHEQCPEHTGYNCISPADC